MFNSYVLYCVKLITKLKLQTKLNPLVLLFAVREQRGARLAADANRAAKRLASIYRELRGAGSSGQSKLQELCEHDDESVRLWAATYTLQLAPAAAAGQTVRLNRFDETLARAEAVLRDRSRPA